VPIPGAEHPRRAQLARNLAAVHARIAAACAAADRDPAQVCLIAVTKFFPATDLAHLAHLAPAAPAAHAPAAHAARRGVAHVGESRDRDAATKLAELAVQDPAARAALRVHFVGQVQTNKVASIARYADVIHSVDRPRLVAALAGAAQRLQRPIDVLLQVDLEEGAAAGRGGAAPADLGALADAVAGAAFLRLAGVMAVAPLGSEPDRAFGRLQGIHSRLLADHPDARWMSAGMSTDLESAIAHGATHLRVGTAILGSRPVAR
jgi:uncharacterized pyridoxal phosphate-containing UPF0001 family protein